MPKIAHYFIVLLVHQEKVGSTDRIVVELVALQRRMFHILKIDVGNLCTGFGGFERYLGCLQANANFVTQSLVFQFQDQELFGC